MEKLRIYVYTAVNGYAWQGCNAVLSSSLASCVEALGLAGAGSGSESSCGGVIRWKVAGENGTAVLRVHTRKAGDFRGRDSRYIALAFLPFRVTRIHPADYRRLWHHPLLAAPQPDPVDDLSLDYGEELWLADGGGDGEGFWTEDVMKTFPPNGEDGVLRDVAALFQSRATQLGALSAVIGHEDVKGLSARLSYKLFSEVAADLRAAKTCKALQGDAQATIESVETARADWRRAVDALGVRAGGMPDFSGLADFARDEDRASSADDGLLIQARILVSHVEELERSSSALYGTVDGSDAQEKWIRQMEGRLAALRDKVRASLFPGRNALLGRLGKVDRALATARAVHEGAVRFTGTLRFSFQDEKERAQYCRGAWQELTTLPNAEWLSQDHLSSWGWQIRQMDERARGQAHHGSGSSSPVPVASGSSSTGSLDFPKAERRGLEFAKKLGDWLLYGVALAAVVTFVAVIVVLFDGCPGEKVTTPEGAEARVPSNLSADKIPESFRRMRCPVCKGRGKTKGLLLKKACAFCKGSGKLKVISVEVQPDEVPDGEILDDRPLSSKTNKKVLEDEKEVVKNPPPPGAAPEKKDDGKKDKSSVAPSFLPSPDTDIGKQGKDKNGTPQEAGVTNAPPKKAREGEDGIL